MMRKTIKLGSVFIIEITGVRYCTPLFLSLLLFIAASISFLFTTAANALTSRPLTAAAMQYCRAAKELWYVPNGQQPIHFLDGPQGTLLKSYVVPGDLLKSSDAEQSKIFNVFPETPTSIFACYIRNNKIVAAGWLPKANLQKFDQKHSTLTSCSLYEDKSCIQAIRRTLLSIASQLPAVQKWLGEYQNGDNQVVIWKQTATTVWLDSSRIDGMISQGCDRGKVYCDENSMTFKPIPTSGALIIPKDMEDFNLITDFSIDKCNTIIIGFNNAIYATTGHGCFGTGCRPIANGECENAWPDFDGIFWKKSLRKVIK